MAMVDTDADRELELAGKALEAFDAQAAAGHLSAAIRALTAAGDSRQAALVCARLGDLYANAMGNTTAARAWFLRATRLIEDEPPCVEQGWVAVAALGCDVDDPAELLARAELALDRARRFGDVNLETKALADAGLACVQAGRVAEGMAMLDEAMALVCGPADDIDVAGKSVCSFFTACYFAADFDRAGSWADALLRHGLLGTAGMVPLFLSAHCDSVQATALSELGRWGEAEAMLTRSIEDFESRLHIPSWHPAIALAELRIRQGRLADAEMLLLGKDGSLQALLPAAHLHLARGDLDLARATAERGLRAIARRPPPRRRPPRRAGRHRAGRRRRSRRHDGVRRPGRPGRGARRPRAAGAGRRRASPGAGRRRAMSPGPSARWRARSTGCRCRACRCSGPRC